MKRLLLGSLLSCMVVGLAFSNDALDNDVLSPNGVGALKGIWDSFKGSGTAGVIGAFGGAGMYKFGRLVNPMVRYRAPMPRYALQGALIGTALFSALSERTSLDRLSEPVCKLEWSNGDEVPREQARGYDAAKAITGMGICGGSIFTLIRMILRK
jgi:hypothetical protein